MNESIKTVIENLGDQIIGYLPNLFAGFLLIAVGWFVGWFVKRIIVRLCIILRIDRLFERFSWAKDFSKADVRLAAYESLGNIAYGVVILIFLSNALNMMYLTTLSNLLDRGILFIPHLLIALAIYGVGWLISYWVSNAIRKALVREEIPRPGLIARFVKLFFLLFFPRWH